MEDLPLCELLYYAVYTYYIEPYNHTMHKLLVLPFPFYQKEKKKGVAGLRRLNNEFKVTQLVRDRLS